MQVVLMLRQGPLLLAAAVDGQGEAHTHLPHGIEAAPGHDSGGDGEVRPAVQLREVHQAPRLLHAQPRRSHLRAAGLHLRLREERGLGQIRQGRSRRDGVGGIVLAQAVEFRQGCSLPGFQAEPRLL
jgi:hypothetical protein